MKILKKIGIVLLSIILLMVIISFFLPSKVHIERSTEIKAKPETVFNLVNNLQAWEKWSPWHKIDSNMKITYSDNVAGVDASYSWTSDHKKVGNGKLSITESTPNTHIKTKLEFGKMEPSYAEFIFDSTADGVKVTWTMDVDMGFNLIGRYFGLMMEKMLAPDYEKGLANLKSVAEAMPAKETIAGFDFEERQLEKMMVMGIREKLKVSDINSAKFAAWYGTIGRAITKENLAMTGAPMSIYYSFDNVNSELEAAIPVKGNGKDEGTVKYHELPACKALVVHYFGSYGKLEPVYNAAFQYISKNGMVSNGPPMEIYVTDPSMQKDTAKWLTEVAFPIQ